MKTLTENYYFDTSKPNAACKIGVQLTELLLKTDRPLDDVIIICIGTDRSTGDSLGPIVGYKLSKALRKSGKKQQKNGITVYGTLYPLYTQPTLKVYCPRYISDTASPSVLRWMPR